MCLTFTLIMKCCGNSVWFYICIKCINTVWSNINITGPVVAFGVKAWQHDCKRVCCLYSIYNLLNYFSVILFSILHRDTWIFYRFKSLYIPHFSILTLIHHIKTRGWYSMAILPQYAFVHKMHVRFMQKFNGLYIICWRHNSHIWEMTIFLCYIGHVACVNHRFEYKTRLNL